MAIQKEIWAAYILGNLFKGNEFLQMAFNADENVLQGKIVHIPQAGGKPGVKKNRATLPATAVKRNDTDITYSLDEFTTDPVLIPNADKIELSYNKIDSVLGEHVQTLRETLGDEFLFNWAATKAANIIRTSGEVVAASAPGATGNRLALVKEDLKKARFLMNKQNIAKEDRFAVLPSDFLEQLQDDPDLKKRDSAMELDLRNGVVTRLYGFNIMERSETTIYTNDAPPAPKAIDAATAISDNLSALCFQKNAVERAIGEILFFENLGDPQYYGDLYSALVRAGGRKRRANELGVIQIVQAASA
jgi:hypothetical protein